MLAMWLVEIWLTQMDQCEEAGDKEGFQTLQQELRAFLTEPKVKVCSRPMGRRWDGEVIRGGRGKTRA